MKHTHTFRSILRTSKQDIKIIGHHEGRKEKASQTETYPQKYMILILEPGKITPEFDAYLY